MRWFLATGRSWSGSCCRKTPSFIRGQPSWWPVIRDSSLEQQQLLPLLVLLIILYKQVVLLVSLSGPSPQLHRSLNPWQGDFFFNNNIDIAVNSVNLLPFNACSLEHFRCIRLLCICHNNQHSIYFQSSLKLFNFPFPSFYIRSFK